MGPEPGDQRQGPVGQAAVPIMAERGSLLVRDGLAPGFIAPFSTVGVRF